MTEHTKKVWKGIGLGVLATLVGLSAFGLVYCLKFDKSFWFFISEAFLGFNYFQTDILFVAVLFNLIPFTWAKKKEKDAEMKGILVATFSVAVLILFLFITQ
jgi:hypothetical protein